MHWTTENNYMVLAVLIIKKIKMKENFKTNSTNIKILIKNIFKVKNPIKMKEKT